MEIKSTAKRKITGSLLAGALPSFMSGFSSLFPSDNSYRFDDYMRGNTADDWKCDWQTIGDDIRTAMGDCKYGSGK